MTEKNDIGKISNNLALITILFSNQRNMKFIYYFFFQCLYPVRWHMNIRNISKQLWIKTLFDSTLFFMLINNKTNFLAHHIGNQHELFLKWVIRSTLI